MSALKLTSPKPTIACHGVHERDERPGPTSASEPIWVTSGDLYIDLEESRARLSPIFRNIRCLRGSLCWPRLCSAVLSGMHSLAWLVADTREQLLAEHDVVR